MQIIHVVNDSVEPLSPHVRLGGRFLLRWQLGRWSDTELALGVARRDLELSLNSSSADSSVSVVAVNRAALVAAVLHRGKGNPAGSRLPRKSLCERSESTPNLLSHAHLFAEAPAATSNRMKLVYCLTKLWHYRMTSTRVATFTLNLHLHPLVQGSLHSPIAEGRLTVASSIPPGFAVSAD